MNKKHLKNVGPNRHASRRTPIQQVSLPVLSRAACASMSTTSTTTTTTTTTTTRDRGDRYGPMEWAQWLKLEHRYLVVRWDMDVGGSAVPERVYLASPQPQRSGDFAVRRGRTLDEAKRSDVPAVHVIVELHASHSTVAAQLRQNQPCDDNCIDK